MILLSWLLVLRKLEKKGTSLFPAKGPYFDAQLLPHGVNFLSLLQSFSFIFFRTYPVLTQCKFRLKSGSKCGELPSLSFCMKENFSGNVTRQKKKRDSSPPPCILISTENIKADATKDSWARDNPELAHVIDIALSSQKKVDWKQSSVIHTLCSREIPDCFLPWHY